MTSIGEPARLTGPAGQFRPTLSFLPICWAGLPQDDQAELPGAVEPCAPGLAFTETLQCDFLD